MIAAISSKCRTVAFAAVLPFLFIALPVLAAAQEEQKTDESAYAGVETCQACHEDITNAFLKQNKHRVVIGVDRYGWKDKACESCHGPGAKHAESADAADIKRPDKIAPAQADKTCLGCHLGTPTQVGRVFGPHVRNQVACVACHTIHKTEQKAVVSKAAQINAQCSACHTSQRIAFQRPHSHPLKTDTSAAGAMACTDCHNPHGSRLNASLRLTQSGEPGCLNCHGDKRGPFLYEHPPVRLEGCQTCHEPHGTTNPRMLTRPEVSQVCLECHANLNVTSGVENALGTVPPAFHDLRNPRFRNCTVCHMKIHGSHVDKDFLK